MLLIVWRVLREWTHTTDQAANLRTAVFIMGVIIAALVVWHFMPLIELRSDPGATGAHTARTAVGRKYWRTPRRSSKNVLARQYSAIGGEIGLIDKNILAWHRSCEASRRLEQIPGIGPICDVHIGMLGERQIRSELGSQRRLSARGRELAAYRR